MDKRFDGRAEKLIEMAETTEFSHRRVSSFDLQMAKSILKEKAVIKKKMFAKFLKLVELQQQSERQCELTIRQGEFEVGIEFMNMTEGNRCRSFMLYDFNSATELNEGIKLIERFFKTGEAIPYHSMTDKKIEDNARSAANR